MSVKKGASAWVVVHIARTEENAKSICDVLAKEGFLVKQRCVSGAAASGDSVFEVLALSSEAREARNVLVEMGL